MDTFYGPLSAHIKNVQLHHIFMKTSEQPCWNNLPHMIIINEHPPLDCTSKWHFWHQFYRTFTNIILQVYRCTLMYRCTAVSTDLGPMLFWASRSLISRHLVQRLWPLFKDRLYIAAILYVLSFTVQIIPSPSGVSACVFISFSSFL